MKALVQEALLGDTCAGCLPLVLPAADARMRLEIAKRRAVRVFRVVRSAQLTALLGLSGQWQPPELPQCALSWIYFALGMSHDFF